MATPDLTLLVLAAGMGSRYGGLKQLATLGPGGETLLDYAVHDARKAGFGRIVFVIRKSFREDFEKVVLSRLPDDLEVELVFQELDTLPSGCPPVDGRTKPWGTGHATLVARDQITGSFAAVNADDYYGQGAYQQAADFLRSEQSSAGELSLGMVAYPLGKTLSPHGSVSRGICNLDTDGKLMGITEQTSIVSGAEGPEVILGNGERQALDSNTQVSMNFFALRGEVMGHLEAQFCEFYEERKADLKAEFYLPEAIARMIKRGQATVDVMSSQEQWLGVTYPEDQEAASIRLRELTTLGFYPAKLW